MEKIREVTPKNARSSSHAFTQRVDFALLHKLNTVKHIFNCNFIFALKLSQGDQSVLDTKVRLVLNVRAIELTIYVLLKFDSSVC